MKFREKYLRAMIYGDTKALPRKVKKQILGKKIGYARLKKIIKNILVIEHKYPSTSQIYPFEFCPFCGCRKSYSSGNMAQYPELYVETYCLRCHNEVGIADNSPFKHILEDLAPKENIIRCADSCFCKNIREPDDYMTRFVWRNEFREVSGSELFTIK